MADPVLITIVKGQWTLVAAAVVTGQVWRKDNLPNYFMTIRDAGGGAPTTLEPEGVQVFTDSDSMPISSSISIDVYLWARGDENGRVRVDL